MSYYGDAGGGYASAGGAYYPELYSKPSVKVFCKSDPYFNLAVKYGTVVLTPNDPNDADQHWYKDDNYGRGKTDDNGFSSFALVNKASNMALMCGSGHMEPVQLMPYDPNGYNEDLLWSQTQDLNEGYTAIRRTNNIRLNLDALNGDQNSGGVQDGTKAVMWEWNGGDNQLWKIMEHC